MKVHYLKTVQPHFNYLWLKQKTFELRKNDRDFSVGDILMLQEYSTNREEYTGNIIEAVITHILFNYHNAIHEEYVILSIQETRRYFHFLPTTPTKGSQPTAEKL